jgi:hypothetical protein
MGSRRATEMALKQDIVPKDKVLRPKASPPIFYHLPIMPSYYKPFKG